MCKYCSNKKQLLTIDIPDVFADFCTGEEELQLIIDRGYLRLCEVDDMQNEGEKVKINYCPMCGIKFEEDK